MLDREVHTKSGRTNPKWISFVYGKAQALAANLAKHVFFFFFFLFFISLVSPKPCLENTILYSGYIPLNPDELQSNSFF